MEARGLPPLAEDGGATLGACALPQDRLPERYYYSAPKKKPELNSLDEADPELIKTFEKLGISLEEQKRLAGVAVDVVFDSVSVKTTFQAALKEKGIIFSSFSEAVHNHPDLIKKYLGSVVPRTDNYFAALNSAVFSDGSFCYIPPGVRCPMELSTYFRINEAMTGQFERTLLIADEGAYVSYLEGCTAPIRDEHQLHAAVVELVALKDAEIKYSTVQNWYPGDKDGKGGIYNFVTKRGICLGDQQQDQLDAGGDRQRHHVEVPELRAEGRPQHRRVLQRGGDEQPPAGRHRHQDGPHRQGHQEHHHQQGHQRRPQQQQLPRSGEDRQGREGRTQLQPVRFAAARRPLRRAHLPVHREREPERDGGARSHHEQDRLDRTRSST
jgi:hypothetical protein